MFCGRIMGGGAFEVDLRGGSLLSRLPGFLDQSQACNGGVFDLSCRADGTWDRHEAHQMVTTPAEGYDWEDIRNSPEMR